MTTKTPQEYAAFLESLKVKNEGPKTQEGWDFDVPINAFILEVILSEKQRVPSFVRYLVERIRRAEANAKPPTLVEDVKAFVRAGMKAAYDTGFEEFGVGYQGENAKLYNEFRRLSEPSK